MVEVFYELRPHRILGRKRVGQRDDEPRRETDEGNERFFELFDHINKANVGMFWRQQPVCELQITGEHLAPGGRLFLFYDSPPGSDAIPDARPAAAPLEGNSLAVVEFLTQDFGRARVGCIVAQKSVPDRSEERAQISFEIWRRT
jgi:hypothetical protein